MSSARARRLLALAAFVTALALVYRQVFLGRVLAGRDVFRLFIPHAQFLAECLARSEAPLWIPYERLGQPFAAIPYAQAFYLPNVLAVLAVGPVASVTALHLFHVAVAAAGTFIACRRLRASFVASAFGACAFALSHAFTLLAHVPNVTGAAAWSGFILAAVHALARRPSLRPAALVAAAFAASLMCGSPETTLWQGLLAAACAAGWLPFTRSPSTGSGQAESKGARSSAVGVAAALAGAFAFAAALAAIMLMPALELSAESTRATGAANPLEWSASFPQLLSIGWPMAHLPMGPYWGGADQRYLTSLYVGTVVCALALSVFSRRRRVLPLAASAVVLALLSAGANFAPAALLLKLPPFDFFRYPAKYVLGALFCLCVLAALGLDRAVARARRFRPRGTPARHLGMIAGAALAACAVGPLLPLRVGALAGWYWLVAALTAAALAWRFAGRRRWPLVAIAAVDLAVAHAVLGTPAFADASALKAPSQLAAKIGEGRISVDLPDDLSLEGGARAYIAQSRDALVPLTFVAEHLRAFEGYGDPEPRRTRALSADRETYELAGVRWFVRAGAPPFEGLEPIATVGPLATLYESPTARPRAYLEAPCESQVALEEPRFTELQLDVEACADGELVVSDAFFPGWEATVDAQPAALHEAHGALRGVFITAGHHVVHMSYRPRPFFVGTAISGLALALLTGVLAWRRNTNAAPQ